MADPTGNIIMKMDSEGLDVIKISQHLKELLGNIELVGIEQEGAYISDKNGYVCTRLDELDSASPIGENLSKEIKLIANQSPRVIFNYDH